MPRRVALALVICLAFIPEPYPDARAASGQDAIASVPPEYRFAAPLGGFVGEVSIFDYGRLCYLLEKSGFDALPARYTADWTDAPTAIVKTISGSDMKVVSEYSGVGPIELWAVQQAIDAVAARIEWTPK